VQQIQQPAWTAKVPAACRALADGLTWPVALIACPLLLALLAATAELAWILLLLAASPTGRWRPWPAGRLAASALGGPAFDPLTDKIN